MQASAQVSTIATKCTRLAGSNRAHILCLRKNGLLVVATPSRCGYLALPMLGGAVEEKEQSFEYTFFSLYGDYKYVCMTFKMK